jgi:DNA-binding NarL/FixJ family response regulator
MMRILIVDGQPLFREALAMHLKVIYPGSAVFETSTVAEAEGVLEAYTQFELIVLDISVPEMEGVARLCALRDKALGSKIVVMSYLDDPAVAKSTLGQGANGYIAKSAGASELRNALHLVLAGEVYISPSLLANAAKPSITILPCIPETNSDGLPLTSRQMEVFRLMAKGLPNKSIASRLNCSDGTVKLHVSAILRALHARNRTEAVQAASNFGFS